MLASRSPVVPRELCATLKVLAGQLRRFPFLPLAAADGPNSLPRPPVRMNALRNRQRGSVPFKELRHLPMRYSGKGWESENLSLGYKHVFWCIISGLVLKLTIN